MCLQKFKENYLIYSEENLGAQPTKEKKKNKDQIGNTD